MLFEYDEYKSDTNAKKHGINFIEAQALWLDPDLLLIPAKTTGEPRNLLIGRIKCKHWTAIATMRGKSTRIISVRRARSKEVKLYENIDF